MPAASLVTLVAPSSSAQRQLYFVHPTGGRIEEYRRLVGSIPARRADETPGVFAITSRALHDAQLEHRTLDAMANEYAALVAKRCGGKPCLLGGWSMGALTAHATAVALEREHGVEVQRVVMIEPRLDRGGARDAKRDRFLSVSMAIQMFNPQPPPPRQLRRTLAQLPRGPVEASALFDWCEQRQLVEADVDRRQFEAAIGLFFRHREVVASHQPGRCAASLEVWLAKNSLGERYDWSAHTAGSCLERSLPTDHFGIMRAPHVEVIAQQLLFAG